MRWGGPEPSRATREAWQEWFAWHPVKLESGEWVWLELVQRRYVEIAMHDDAIRMVMPEWAPTYRDRPPQPGDQYL